VKPDPSSVPVLWILFNRPSETEQSLRAIRAAKPQKLFIACDGPRPDRPRDRELIEQVRNLAEHIDWPCQVNRLYSPHNLGCGRGVSRAIDWFFKQVEEGIILEDDTVPCQNFFKFCAVLLERHRHDQRIATIGGTHFLPESLQLTQSHYASKYFQMWGWASWRRVWNLYSFSLDFAPMVDWEQILATVHTSDLERRVWLLKIKAIIEGSIDTWDFQMIVSAWRHGMFHIMPSRNLVTNVGYGTSATHTTFESGVANRPAVGLPAIDSDPPLSPDPQIDDWIFFVRYLDSLRQTYWLEHALSNPAVELHYARNQELDGRPFVELANALAVNRRLLRQTVKKLSVRL